MVTWKEYENWVNSHKLLIVGGIFLAFFVLIAGCVAILGTDSGDTKESNVAIRVSIGEKGKLYLEGETLVPVCINKGYFDELVDAAVAKDEIGYRNLIMSYGERCYMASTIEPYGKVLVLDRDWGATKFRFIHPDSLHYGKTAWTFMERIIPI